MSLLISLVNNYIEREIEDSELDNKVGIKRSENPANIHTIRTPIIDFSKNFIVIISEFSISKKIVEETNPSINFCKPINYTNTIYQIIVSFFFLMT